MRIIDADELLNVFNDFPDKSGTAIFVNHIIEIINEQPTVEPDKGPTEIVINAKAWEDLPVDAKAKLLMAVRGNEVCITGYNKQLIKGGE